MGVSRSTFLMMMTLFFAGMGAGQPRWTSTPRSGSRGVAGAIAMVLAIIRYKQRKKAGE